MTTRSILPLALLAAAAGAQAAAAAEVNIYTTREPGLIQPLLDAYKAETGVTVNTIFMKDGLAERVEALRVVVMKAGIGQFGPGKTKERTLEVADGGNDGLATPQQAFDHPVVHLGQ